LNRTGIFKYSKDSVPVGMVFLAVGLSMIPVLIHLPLWFLVPYFFLVIFVRSFCPFAQHNHAHLPVFNSSALNHVYDAFLTLATGYATALWELHHNRGHHRHFLSPEKDVARIVDLKSGEVMPRWWYGIRGNLTILRDSISIGFQEAREGKKSLLPKLTGEIIVQWAIGIALLVLNPVMTIAFFVIPNIFASFFVWWESYPHHLHVPTQSIYDGSVTIQNKVYNLQTFNIGHHTAHHEKPTLHWSLLPQRTEAIRDQIPAMCLHESYSRSARKQLEYTLAMSKAVQQTVQRVQQL
jgi:fatty acid desaturase